MVRRAGACPPPSPVHGGGRAPALHRFLPALCIPFLLLLCGWKPGDGPVIRAGHEAYFTANVDAQATAACGWAAAGVSIKAREVVYRFRRAGGSAAVKLTHRSRCKAPVKALFCVSATMERGAEPGGACGAAFLEKMVREGVRKNPGTFTWFVARPNRPAKPSSAQSDSRWPELGQLWLVGALMLALLAALGTSLVRARPWRGEGRAEVVGLAVCLLGAAGARLALEPFPADVWLSTSQGVWAVALNHWAAAYSAVLHAVFLVSPPTLATAAAANVLLSCATVLAVYALATVLWKDRLMGLASAAVLAFQPISIRYAASDSPHVLYALCLILSALFTLLWIRRGGYLWALQAAGWLAVCVNTRDEAVVAAGAVACVLAAKSLRRSPARLRQLLAAGGPMLVAAAYPLWVAVDAVLNKPKIARTNWLGLVESPFFLSPHSPVVVVALAAVGAAVVLARPRLRRPGLAWGAAIYVICLPSIYITDAGWEHTHRHCLPSLAMLAVVAGLGLGWLLGPGLTRVVGALPAHRAWPWTRATLVLAVAATAALPNTDFLTKTWTHALELRFLQQNLGKVADGCTVVAVRQPDAHVGLNLFPVLSHEVGRRHRWMEPRAFLDSRARLPACTVFIESASCHASHARPASAKDGVFPACAAIMERHVMEPVASTTVPGLPYIGEVFTRDPVPLGIYRVLGKKPRTPH